MFAPIRPGQAVADIVGFRRAEHAEKREGLPPFTLGPDGLARGVMTVGQAAEGAGLLVLVAYSTSARLTRLWEVTAQLLVLSPRTPACLSRSLAWSKRPMRRSSWPRLFSVRASSEEREAERARAEAARAEQSQAAEEKRRHDAFLTTPLGAATAAKEAGQPFLEIQLEVGGHVGSAQFGITDGRRTSSSTAATLGEIEKIGWRLEHAGYYLMITGETSSNRFIVSGQAVAVSGATIGVYLFRNAALAASSE